jgi:mannose-6-phosphate isomerase-like protein (cupin superfamily)
LRSGAARLSIGGKSPQNIEAGDFIHLPRRTRYHFQLEKGPVHLVSVQIFPPPKERPGRTNFPAARSMPDILSHTTIAEVFARFHSNQPIHSSPNYTLNYVIYSKKSGPWEAHRGCVDLYFVHTGTADAELGGDITNPKEESPGEIRGTGVSNARKHRIGPGDMVLIPREVAHYMRPLKDKLGYILMKIWAE